jgi:hypothetical protein
MSRAGSLIVSLALLLAVSGHDAAAQCMLANPSFEVAGSGGNRFAGWNQFGAVGASTSATHGAVAARVSGPNQGGWDVSAYWQRQDAAPGERWTASGDVWHGPARPLTGDARAIVNIEWRSASGALIAYESFAVADAATPPDAVRPFTVTSGPAPAGTAAVHFLVAVLQSPTAPVPDVFYDAVSFDSLGPPTLDERQWTDFPGGRTLSFSGRTWRVKGPGYYGPGPNLFSDAPSSVWVDGNGRMHVTVRRVGSLWYSSEVALVEPLGYGDYIFTTRGRLDTLHPNIVLGLFLWQYGACYDPAYLWWNPHNEIDIEWSRWGVPGNGAGQFVAQPFDYPGNLRRFDAAFTADEIASHAFRWLDDRVEFRSWRGGPGDESSATMIQAWTYTGPHIPRPEQPRVHVNLWQFEAPPATDQEIVLDAFTFVPAGSPSAVGDAPAGPGAAESAVAPRSMARPNPFNPRTTIVYTAAVAADAEIHIFATSGATSGRLVRTLWRGAVPPGEHAVVWDGRDDDGVAVATGVYLYRLRVGQRMEARPLVLLK